ncbi:hypothetical protein [Aulosira sp. FACHB-615]|uniref:hypothetical protein n=1 Tax=Aulosira sp. FACHB-615 TaxID=2692777 RepID=UPI0019CF0865|nr:hypothetical protein [Aulosira sp. FACHB-615]MBD2486091.1 hypothetical protein [Aulosira sp. FACHB-615]
MTDIKKTVNHYTKLMFFHYINIFAICISNVLLFSNKNAQIDGVAGGLSILIKNVIFVAAVSLILNIKIINKWDSAK